MSSEPTYAIGDRVIVDPAVAWARHLGVVYRVTRLLPVNVIVEPVGGGRPLKINPALPAARARRRQQHRRRPAAAAANVELVPYETPLEQGTLVTVAGPGWKQPPGELYVVLRDNGAGRVSSSSSAATTATTGAASPAACSPSSTPPACASTPSRPPDPRAPRRAASDPPPTPGHARTPRPPRPCRRAPRGLRGVAQSNTRKRGDTTMPITVRKDITVTELRQGGHARRDAAGDRRVTDPQGHLGCSADRGRGQAQAASARRERHRVARRTHRGGAGAGSGARAWSRSSRTS